MNYNIIVDGEEFIFNEVLFEQELKRLLLKYKYSNCCFLSLIILDNNDAREYLVKRLKENIDDLCSIDFNVEGTEFKKINKIIKQDKKPLIIYNLKKAYSDYAIENDEYLNYCIKFELPDKFKEKYIKDKKALARSFLFQSINMARDGLFLENNAKFFMILNDDEYLEFTYDVGDDFASYCQTKPDFNSCFINKDYVSLSEYYKEKNLPSKFKKQKKIGQ